MRFLAVLSIVLVSSSCIPVRMTKMRQDWPSNAAPMTVRQEGITVSIEKVNDFGPEFAATAPLCDEKTPIETKMALGKPVMATYALQWEEQENDSVWVYVRIRNDTSHVTRLEGVLPRLFTPNGEKLAAKSDYKPNSAVLCAIDELSAAQKRIPRLRFPELVPGEEVAGWYVFSGVNARPGKWKFTLYEVPVEVDQAGTPTKRTAFEFDLSLRIYEELLEKATLVAPWKQISTREVTQ